MYLVTCMHPDLAFTISFLSQFSAQPTPIHHTAITRVFRYLQGTKTNKISYPTNGSLTLTGYSDASYANCITTRRPYSSYVFYLGDCPISWMSRKQQSVVTSTTEVDYMALSLAARQTSWYEHVSKQFKLSIPISLKCDNQSGIKLAKNPLLHQRSKHIDVHYHFTREHLLSSTFTLEYVQSNNNVADIMTNGLSKELHHKFLPLLRCTG
jgi:hypothetical protein